MTVILLLRNKNWDAPGREFKIIMHRTHVKFRLAFSCKISVLYEQRSFVAPASHLLLILSDSQAQQPLEEETSRDC